MLTTSSIAEDIAIKCNNPHLRTSVEKHIIEQGLAVYRIRFDFQQTSISPVTLEWSHSAIDIHSFWHAGADRNRGLQVDWGKGFQSKNTSLAPICCLYNIAGQNRLCFAVSDALNPVEMKAGIHEEDATFLCSILLFKEHVAEKAAYELQLRVDTRQDIYYYDAIRDVERWWATLPGYYPAPVPDTATYPMYSTWYSFHQLVTPSEIELQCRLAKEFGCEAIILDDGWQTSDIQRKYTYTGDWQVAADKIPDMKAHVQAVHEMGMKYLVWYSVPFVGMKSKAWTKFQGKMLSVIEDAETGVLDPRYPEVREYIIAIYEQAVREWNIDGLKLDFVDSFPTNPSETAVLSDGRDYESVSEAVDRLLEDVMTRLRIMKPDIMVEFRQSYIGPLMRKYGNIFRANDCPNDSIQNRVRTLDLRLMSGETAVHSDMIMWHLDDTVESAALQLINILFSVPQVSVRIDKLSTEHKQMLQFWLSFFRENRDVLLFGELKPLYPELLYPLVSAVKDEKEIVALYAPMVIELNSSARKEMTIVNGTYAEEMVLKAPADWGMRTVKVFDSLGRKKDTYDIHIKQGVHAISVPKSGLITLFPA